MSTVWTAILNGHPGPTFDQIVASRRGYAGGSPELLPNNTWPSYFSNPFRTFGGGPMQVATLLPAAQQAANRRREVDLSLMRRVEPQGAFNSTTNETPLFVT